MKILIVKTSSLGDIIHTFPALEYLKKKYPQAQIDWVVEAPFSELLEANPYVDHVIKINTKTWRKGKALGSLLKFIKNLRSVSYDLLIDFQGNTKSAFVTLFAKAKTKVGFGKEAASEWPNLLVTNYKVNPEPSVNVRQENLALVQSYFQDPNLFCSKGIELKISDIEKKTLESICAAHFLAKKIMICPGSVWKNKRMNLSSWIDFLRNSDKAENRYFLTWGNEEEKTLALEIQKAFPDKAFLVEKMSLSALQNLMQAMDLVIAMDSLPLHLAGTTSVPTFGIFGPSSALKYSPEGQHHSYFQGPCPYGKTFNKRCPYLRTCPTGACLKGNIEHELIRAYHKA